LGITYLADPAEAVGRDTPQRRAWLHVGGRSRNGRTRSGLPSLWDRDHWDPIIEAIVETDTVVSLHVGSSGMPVAPPGAPILQLGATLFGQMALTACAEWLWSGHPVRHPDLKIAMSEGGIGWVAMLLDRLDNHGRPIGLRGGLGPAAVGGAAAELLVLHHRRPIEIDTATASRIGHIMVEVDYPHGDSHGLTPRT